MRWSIVFNKLPGLMLGLSGILGASACGDHAVNLGTNPDGWYPDDATRGTSGAGGATPFSLYGPGSGATYAVDESRLYLVRREYDDSMQAVLVWKICELTACASTVRTLYRRPGHLDFTSIALADSEVFFTVANEDVTNVVMACPRDGCDNAPREVVRSPWPIYQLVATGDAVYTLSADISRGNGGTTLTRCARGGSNAPVSRTFSGSENVSRIVVEGDYIYSSSSNGIVRFRNDLQTEAEILYATTQGGNIWMAIEGDSLYFAISSLAGEIRRCPISGCVTEPEVLVPGLRWPHNFIADNGTLYWFTPNGSPDDENATASLFARHTTGSGVRRLTSEIPPRSTLMLTNSHHLYWAEYPTVTDYSMTIWSMAK